MITSEINCDGVQLFIKSFGLIRKGKPENTVYVCGAVFTTDTGNVV